MENVKALIISDGKAGHLNQSIALCKYKNWEYEIVEVAYKTKRLKAVSYVLDFFGYLTDSIFVSTKAITSADIIVATGSTTYYPTKVLAKKLLAKKIAIMLPKGYRYDFDYIIAQSHDNPPELPNIIELPINLTQTKQAFDHHEMSKRYDFSKQSKYIGVIIGGPNGVFEMETKDLEMLFEHLLSLKDYKIVVTTSRRTPYKIEEGLSKLPLEFLLKYSEDKYNPIPVFLQNCSNIIITSDSTSMISEAVVGGSCVVDVLMLPSKKNSKFHALIHKLEGLESLHIFDGTLGNANKKIKLETYLERVIV